MSASFFLFPRRVDSCLGTAGKNLRKTKAFEKDAREEYRFYRAMLCYAVARCLSVGLSHAGILSKRLNISSNLFHRRVFLHTKRYGNIPTRAPLTGRRMHELVWKNSDFCPISRFISEMMQDTAIVTMEGEYETAPKLANGTNFNDLE